MNQWKVIACGALWSALGCAVQSEDVAAKIQEQTTSIDVRRSLAITEQSILSRFSLERLMNHLAGQIDVPGVTGTTLFQQLWDTQNAGPGLFPGPHCDDVVDPVLGEPRLNGFPYICREAPSEGYQSSCDPFAESSDCAYVPIGLFNRFDLAPENGDHCGEYRIVYAKESGISESNQRALIIFEAVMPNPLPQLGLKGCNNIVRTWSRLSNDSNIGRRATTLEKFYFEGTGLIPPAMHIDHLGAAASGVGQLRTNQFVFADADSGNTGWMLREFKLQKTCNAEGCTSLLFIPVTTKTNPAAELFAPGSIHPQADAFRADFVGGLSGLLAASIPGISLSVPDQFNMAQSAASGPFVSELDYNAALGAYPSPLRAAIEAELTSTTLSVENVLERARTQTCAGCHRRSRNADLGDGLTWPEDLGFVHVSESITEEVDGETRFEISDALKDEFLPARATILEDFLNDTPRPPQANPATPLIGHWHHG